MLDGTNVQLFPDTPKWKYHCDAGEYTANSLPSLLYEIFTHRLSHLIKGEGFRD